MISEVTSSYKAREIEEQVRQFWEREEIYRRTKEAHARDPDFFFVDGPPYTTAHIHLGTAWNKILKDSILPHARMTGRNVIARAGYDMHGLPIEVRVEQELGFTSKKDIEQFGIGPFHREMPLLCRRQPRGDEPPVPGPWRLARLRRPVPDHELRDIEAAWWTLQQADRAGMLENN